MRVETRIPDRFNDDCSMRVGGVDRGTTMGDVLIRVSALPFVIFVLEFAS